MRITSAMVAVVTTKTAEKNSQELNGQRNGISLIYAREMEIL